MTLSSHSKVELAIRRSTVVMALLVANVLVVACGSVAHLVRHLWIADIDSPLSHLLGRIDLVEEPSLAQWYSASLHLCISLINAGIAVSFRGKLFVGWMGLALLFLFTSIDEAVMIHEMLDRPTREAFGTSDWFSIAWILPGAVIALVIGLAYIKFLAALPRGIAVTFIVAGIVFLSGAILMEIPGGHLYEKYGFSSWHYIASYAIEELLELLGLVTFVHGLLKYVAVELGSNDYKSNTFWANFWQLEYRGAE